MEDASKRSDAPGGVSSPDEGGTDKRPYDLSFAYSFRWEHPDTDIHEAFKILLCSGQVAGSRGVADAGSTSSVELARVRWLIATNPNTPPPVLDSLIKDASDALLERIAEHPRTRPATLTRLAGCAEPGVRAAVAENLNTPVDTLWTLARDENPDVRYRLAENHHTPPDILEELTSDDNPYVANRAQRTLARLRPSAPLVGSFEEGPRRRWIDLSQGRCL